MRPNSGGICSMTVRQEEGLTVLEGSICRTFRSVVVRNNEKGMKAMGP